METTQNVTDTPTAVPQLGRSVTIQRAAEILGVSRRTVYYRISEGVLQTIRTRGGSQRGRRIAHRLPRSALARPESRTPPKMTTRLSAALIAFLVALPGTADAAPRRARLSGDLQDEIRRGNPRAVESARHPGITCQ